VDIKLPEERPTNIFISSCVESGPVGRLDAAPRQSLTRAIGTIKHMLGPVRSGSARLDFGPVGRSKCIQSALLVVESAT